MENLLIDIVPIALLIITIIGMRPVKPFSSFNDDYLSLSTGKYYRGVFAIVIVLHHIMQNTSTGYIMPQFLGAGVVGVAFFFFMSGYGLQKSYMKKGTDYRKGFLIKRLAPILTEYVIVTIICQLLYLTLGTVYTPIDVFRKIAEGFPIAPASWFIISISVFYIVYYLLMVVCKKHYMFMVVGAFIYCILNLIVCKKLDFGMWWYDANHLLVIGMLWAILEDKILPFIKRFYIVLAPVIWICFIGVYLFDGTILTYIHIPHPDFVIAVVTTTLFIFSFILFSLKFTIGNKILEFLGGISLEIYLMHGVFTMYFHADVIYINTDILFALAVIACAIITAYLLHFVSKLFVKDASRRAQ